MIGEVHGIQHRSEKAADLREPLDPRYALLGPYRPSTFDLRPGPNLNRTLARGAQYPVSARNRLKAGPLARTSPAPESLRSSRGLCRGR